MAHRVSDPGRVLVAFRTIPPLGFFLVFLVGAGLLAGVGLALAPNPALGASVAAAPPLIAALAFLVGHRFDRVRVCEHGLRLGFRGGLVVPYASIDPGRVYASRTTFLPRHVNIPTSGARGVAGPAVLLNGAAGPTFAPNLAGAPRTGASPYGWYLVSLSSKRKRRRLLEALEHAMIADGQPAVGLAAAVRDLRTINPTFSTGGPRIVVDRLEGDPPLGVAAPKPA